MKRRHPDPVCVEPGPSVRFCANRSLCSRRSPGGSGRESDHEKCLDTIMESKPAGLEEALRHDQASAARRCYIYYVVYTATGDSYGHSPPGRRRAWRYARRVDSRSTTASGPPRRASSVPASTRARGGSPCRYVSLILRPDAAFSDRFGSGWVADAPVSGFILNSLAVSLLVKIFRCSFWGGRYELCRLGLCSVRVNYSRVCRGRHGGGQRLWTDSPS